MSLSPPEVIRESCRCSAINSMELNQKLKLKQRNATNATVHCRFREFFLSLKLFLPPSIELVGTRFL